MSLDTELNVESAPDVGSTHTEKIEALEVIKPVDSFPCEDDRPCWRIYDQDIQHDGKMHRPGVYWHGFKRDSKGNVSESINTWACGPLHVEAVTTNAEDGEHGRLLRFLSATGNWKKWAMPMGMLAGDSNEVRSVLLDDGLLINTEKRNLITSYLSSQHTNKRLKAATVTGWHGDAFVLPNEVIGADDIWFQAPGRIAPYGVAGTLDDWKAEVAAMAVGNPALILAISAALAGPVLESLNIDGGGIHLYGDSSTGKTTALMAGVSAWGGPRYRRTWRATSNGLEGAAKLHTGTLLALDEIGEVAPKDLYEAVYALCNGSGKSRANVHGNARDLARWRVFVLSTGEVTIASRMSAGGLEAKAGQAVRVLDIPVSGKHGLFDELHGRPSGAALSQAVVNAAAKSYGHAGPAFVRAWIEWRKGGHPSDDIAGMEHRFGKFDGQDGRAARLLAVCALAGEIAARKNIVPWGAGAAADAAVHAFKLWRESRSLAGKNVEHEAILQAVADFIDKHGDSRFSPMNDRDDSAVRDRAGYWRSVEGKRHYLFASSALKEATKGYDLSRVLKALEQAGALADMDYGKRSKKVRVCGRPMSLYHIDPDRLSNDDQP